MMVEVGVQLGIGYHLSPNSMGWGRHRKFQHHTGWGGWQEGLRSSQVQYS